MEISICMVSLNCFNVLVDCLKSINEAVSDVKHEIIIIDNASSDGTAEKIANRFRDAKIIQNPYNMGFSKGTNQAIRLSSGRYILWLNTDTILKPYSLHDLYQFLESHPKAGIVGPKVLNPDGTFQPQCRRGMPTPSASLFYSLKLHRLWPNSRVVGQYLLTYLPMDSANQVDAVSGSCLLARREVWQGIGPLDENIFGFGEDLDWCVRARKAGWEVWYYPESVITHLKGLGGAHAKPYHKAFGMHQAMWVFYRKHLMSRYSWLVTGIVWLGITIRLLFSLTGVWLCKALRTLCSRIL